MSKISKPTKIIFAVILLLILGGFAVLFFGFPGLRQYNIMTNELTGVNVAAEEYPYSAEIPDDFTGAGGKGFELKLPPEITVSGMEDGNIIFSDGIDGGTSVILTDKATYTEKDYNITDESGVTAEEWEKFCRSIGRDTPDSYYALLDAAYSVTLDDFDIHSRGNSKAFASLAALKESLIVEGWRIYRFESENAVGFIFDTGFADGSSEQRQFIVQLFPKSDKNEEHMAIITSPDAVIIRQIIASTDLVEKGGSK